MANADYVAFYSTYLEQHPQLKKTIEDIADPMEFVRVVIAEGNKAGFPFNEVDVETVMQASLRAHLSSDAELSDLELETVAGGVTGQIAQIPMVKIDTLSTTNNIASQITPFASGGGTIMCYH